MTSLFTLLAFVAITVLLVVRHLRKSGTGQGAGPAASDANCPRCGAGHVPGAQRCSACGVPLSAYEIVNAPIAASDEGLSGVGAGALHAIVRADLCVGCGTCVAACPEPGALRMQGKLSVVDQVLCKGHARCVEACPVGAIVVTTGAAVHRVEVPLLDAHFRTSVPGLYIVGELGGRGLIKNAINEGRIAVEHINSERLGEGNGARAGDEVLDLAIVGSGPAGLSAGLEALRLGLRYEVLEQGGFADSIRRYPRHKVLLAEPVSMPVYGNLWIADASKEKLLDVWEDIRRTTGLSVRTGTRVTNIVRKGDRFEVETDTRSFLARRVVLAMGRRGTPRRLGVAGEDLPKVVYDIIEMEAFQGRRVLVVGGGDSAVESAVGLANQEGTEVTLIYRGESFGRVKERNLSKLQDASAGKRLKILLQSGVVEIRPGEVILETRGEPAVLPNDDVIVRIGGDAPYPFLQRIGVRIVRKDVPIPGVEYAAAG